MSEEVQQRIPVRFQLSPAQVATTAVVVGEFNEWSTEADPMEHDGETFAAVIHLAPGVYRYRFLLDGERWENDWSAHSYRPNDFGGDDSIVEVRDGVPASETSDDVDPLDVEAATIDARSENVAEQIAQLEADAQKMGRQVEAPAPVTEKPAIVDTPVEAPADGARGGAQDTDTPS